MSIRAYYKYKFGYINIDESTLYLTSTGNWSEITVLREKVFGKSSKKIGKVVSIYLFLTVSISITILIFLFHPRLKYAIVPLVIGVSGFLRLKKYFETEVGQRFFIPKNKIISIVQENDSITLNFYTRENTPDKITIKGIEGDLEKLKQELQIISH